jgi:hypothetical protein
MSIDRTSNMTLQVALTVTGVIAMNASLFDRVPDSTLAAVAKTGEAYTGEVRRMAQELIDLRAKLATQQPTTVAPIDWSNFGP